MPVLKQTMDLFLSQHPKEEHEAQQLILRDNNFGGVSRATDYYVCDIEYANPHGRFDLVAVHWPSNGAIRKQQDSRRLVLVEAEPSPIRQASTPTSSTSTAFSRTLPT